MGVGNLICMPLALAVGRRAIYLGSLVVLILGGLLAAYLESYEWHLGARMIFGLAAGNSEALVPMVIQVCRPRGRNTRRKLNNTGNSLHP